MFRDQVYQKQEVYLWEFSRDIRDYPLQILFATDKRQTRQKDQDAVGKQILLYNSQGEEDLEKPGGEQLKPREAKQVNTGGD